MTQQPVTSAKVMTGGIKLPAGATLLGWIDHHPTRKFTCTVLRFDATGVETAWDGVSLYPLPRDWRDRVKFDDAADAPRPLPQDWAV